MSDYAIRQLEQIPDVLGDYPGEMRMCAASDLGAEQVSFTWRRMPAQTGGKGSYGHRHKTQEEIYFVASGTLQFKLESPIDLESNASDQSAMASTSLVNIDLQGKLPKIASGKVRDLFVVDDNTLLFVASDRISAYDVVMENVSHSGITIRNHARQFQHGRCTRLHLCVPVN